jgi:hypothetical protein
MLMDKFTTFFMSLGRGENTTKCPQVWWGYIAPRQAEIPPKEKSIETTATIFT